MGNKQKARDGRIAVLIMDEHPTVREALSYAIANEEDIEVCGAVGSAAEALSLVDTQQPDIVIADMMISDAYGLDLVHNIQALASEAGVIFFSMYDETIFAQRALQAGAKGYLMKTEPTREVIKAIRHVMQGEVYLSKRMMNRMLTSLVRSESPRLEYPIETLTNRELAVLQMIGNGCSIPDIVERLNLSRKTIETYRRRAKEKLGLKSSNELVHFAIQWVSRQGGPAGTRDAEDGED